MIRADSLFTDFETEKIHDSRELKPLIAIDNQTKEKKVLTRLISVQIRNKYQEVPCPNPIAITFDLALKNAQQARSISADLNSTSAIYDFIQHAQAAIVFSCQAVETMANLLLPEEIDYEGCLYTRKQAELQINTVEKISKALPSFYKIKRPTSLSCWSNYKMCIALRNEIVHPKFDSLTEPVNASYQVFFKERMKNMIASCGQIIEFYCDNCKGHPFLPKGFSKETFLPVLHVDFVNTLRELKKKNI